MGACATDPDAQKRGRTNPPFFFRRGKTTQATGGPLSHSWSINRYYTTERERKTESWGRSVVNCAIRATCFRLAGKCKKKKKKNLFSPIFQPPSFGTTVWAWLVDVDDRPSQSTIKEKPTTTTTTTTPASRYIYLYIWPVWLRLLRRGWR